MKMHGNKCYLLVFGACISIFLFYRLTPPHDIDAKDQIEYSDGSVTRINDSGGFVTLENDSNVPMVRTSTNVTDKKSGPITNDFKVPTIRTSTHVSVPVKQTRPKILIWAKPYVKYNWILSDLPNDDGGCDITLDRKEFIKSDAVVFFMKTCNPKDLPDPKSRTPNQAFVWWSHESPKTVLHMYGYTLKAYNDYFNWTMTFRRDSDVLASFAPVATLDYLLYKFDRRNEMKDGELLNRPSISEKKFYQELGLLISKKSKFISWAVSDCNALPGATKRRQIVNDMTKDGLLKVDIFGKCGSLQIPDDFTLFLATISEYKFYLAFENSYHCRDYLTEKSLYNCLVAGTVPIVYGPTKQDTEKILPKGSFIHMDDFKNMEEFAQYLKYLDSNNAAYSEYFQWWKEPGAHLIPRYGLNFGTSETKSDESNWFHSWDQDNLIQSQLFEIKRLGLYHLCRKLRNNDHVTTSKTIKNMNEWWYGTESSECLQK